MSTVNVIFNFPPFPKAKASKITFIRPPGIRLPKPKPIGNKVKQ